MHLEWVHCTKHVKSAGRGNVGDTNTATRVQYRSFWFEQSVSNNCQSAKRTLDDSGTMAVLIM